MRALDRAGRHAEALDGYAGSAPGSPSELGLDPGPELVALHREMLARDAAWRRRRRAGPHQPAGAGLPTLVGRDEARRRACATG